jgi:hypothetical protein
MNYRNVGVEEPHIRGIAGKSDPIIAMAVCRTAPAAEGVHERF